MGVAAVGLGDEARALWGVGVGVEAVLIDEGEVAVGEEGVCGGDGEEGVVSAGEVGGEEGEIGGFNGVGLVGGAEYVTGESAEHGGV